MVNNNKVTSFVNALNDLVDGKEDVSNKVTSISSSSTNTHYPTAKAVYDAINNHTHTYSDVDNVSYVTATITYVDQTTQTVKLLKYDGS